MPAPITITRTGTGWTADVTSLELSTSLAEIDIVGFTATSQLSPTSLTKTTSTLVTYTGAALPTDTVITLYRFTMRDIDLLQFAEAVSERGMNQRIDTIERRLDDIAQRLSTLNPLDASPSSAITAHEAKSDPHPVYVTAAEGALYLDRSNHVGTQLASTISNLTSSINSAIGAASINDLADVAIASPSIGQVLKWQGSTWSNDTDIGGASGLANLSLGTITNSTLDILLDVGTDVTLPSATDTLAGLFPSASKLKLDGIAAGATANSPDATLLNRANHTGTQAAATITGLGSLATLSTVGTAQIDNSAVTYAKLQNVSTNNRLLGRSTAGAGVIEELTVGSGLNTSGGGLSLNSTLSLTGLTVTNQSTIGGVRLGLLTNTTDTIFFGSTNNARISINAGNNGIGLRASDGSVSVFASGGVERVRFDNTAPAMFTSNAFRPFTDGTTSMRFQNSTGSVTLLNFDTTNSIVSLNASPPVSDNTTRLATTGMVQSAIANRFVEANRATSQTLTGSNVFDTIVFSTEVTDQAAQYDPATGLITISANNAGAYVLNTTVTLNSLPVTTGIILSFFRNGTEFRVAQETYAAGSFPVLSGSAVINVGVGDTISVRISIAATGSFSTFASASVNFFNAGKL